MRRDRLASTSQLARRMSLLFAAPILAVFALSLACTMQTPPYAEYQRATEAAISAHATAYAQAVHATATAQAPAVRVTATSMAQRAESAAPAELRRLAEEYGLHFVQVPAGEFTMSEDNAEFGKAAVTLTLKDYWTGLTEVTNAQYSAFINAGGYQDRTLWSDEGWTWVSEQYAKTPACWEDADFNAPEQPVTCVTWHEAEAYTRWLSRETGLPVRLPTVEEWEKAARGTDARRFPWGNAELDNSRASYAGAWGKTAPVGSHPAGASPYGALDMAGNVAEWTSTQVDFGEDYMARGGSWYDLAGSLPALYNMFYPPDFRMNTVGIRLAITE